MTACSAQSSDTRATDSAATPAATSASKTGNCTDPEYRQLDFWLGEWDLSWTQNDGKPGQGTNSITQQPYDNCVIMENFDGAPTMEFKGMSVSTWHKPSKLWRQAWVDDQGGFFSLYGGPNEDGTFSLEMERPGDRGPFRRMVWEDITDKSLVWRWQGKSSVEKPWIDQWVIYYAKRSD